jgi:hypothetical protein
MLASILQHVARVCTAARRWKPNGLFVRYGGMDATATTTSTPASDSATRDVRKRKLLRYARNAVLIALGLLFAIWLVLFITKGRFLKRPFESIASSAAGREVSVGGDFQLYFAPLRIKFLVEQLNVTNPQWADRKSLFTAKKVDARIAPLSLLFGRKHFYTIELVDFDADFEWDKAHKRNTWTFGDGSGGDAFTMPQIDRAIVAGTRIRYLDPRMPLLANLTVEPIRRSARRCA